MSKKMVLRARRALNSAVGTTIVDGRSALGRFMPGPRPTAAMAHVEAEVLANPGMSAQALANKIGVGKTSVKRAKKRLSASGQFIPGPRNQCMDQAKAAVLAYPNLSAYALAKKIGISKQTVLRAQKALGMAADAEAEAAKEPKGDGVTESLSA